MGVKRIREKKGARNEDRGTSLDQVVHPLHFQNEEDGFRNLSGFVIDPVYGPGDVAQLNAGKDLGRPGEFPFTRGIHQTMYRGRLWTIRQLGSLGSSAEANIRIRNLLAMGATGVSICLDMPTIMGRDSDDPLCEGEVGSSGGVAIDCIDDVRQLLDGIDLDRISINWVSNAQSCVILAFFVAVAEERGISADKLAGTLQNDVLKEYQAQKSFYFPPKPSMRLTVDTIKYCCRHMPRFNPISISGYHLASAGANPMQELAFALANGFTYVEETVKAGVDVDQFAPRLSFFFKAHNDFFENIAKYRAARRIWARAMKEKYHAQDERSWVFRVHTQTSGSSLTAQQPENNIIRTTLQALSAVLAGTQSLHTNAFDEAHAIPSPRTEKLALRTQQIIAHESGVINTVDPLGGSYYLESLTNKMEEGAFGYFEKIEKLGGVLSGIEKGFFQREIADSAYRYQKDIENKRRIIVGLNEYREDGEEPIETREPDPAFEARKIAELKAFKKRRNPKKVSARTEQICEVAQGDGELMPLLVEAAKDGLTLGEIIGAMREVFGEYREEAIF
jgi:methylmalonyl-CoA mutase N-terminal domain/subunit